MSGEVGVGVYTGFKAFQVAPMGFRGPHAIEKGFKAFQGLTSGFPIDLKNLLPLKMVSIHLKRFDTLRGI